MKAKTVTSESNKLNMTKEREKVWERQESLKRGVKKTKQNSLKAFFTLFLRPLSFSLLSFLHTKRAALKGIEGKQTCQKEHKENTELGEFFC